MRVELINHPTDLALCFASLSNQRLYTIESGDDAGAIGFPVPCGFVGVYPRPFFWEYPLVNRYTYRPLPEGATITLTQE